MKGARKVRVVTLVNWEEAESLTLTEAACLLWGKDPSDLRAIEHRATTASYVQEIALKASELGAEAWRRELDRAVKARTLPAQHIVVKGFGSPNDFQAIDPATIGPHEVLVPELTTVAPAALIQWCIERRFPIPAPFALRAQSSARGTARIHFPDELRAAVEAFRTVSRDPTATAKRSPKAALHAWLKQNKPELSANARERIATVSNWQPNGGAPKTPGE